MNEKPEVPQPVPEIPRIPLWSTLLAPPLMMFLGNMAATFVASDRFSVSLGLLPLMFFVIIGFTVRFNHLVSERYRGRSLVFLNIAFFLGQIIVCIALWFGSCVMFFS